MKKRLLLSSVVALMGLSSFAFEANELVYTPQGRFQITEAANKFTGSIANFSGFTGMKGNQGAELSTLFQTGTEESVGDYFQSASTVVDSIGMATKLPLEIGSTYVVSFKVKADALTSAIPSANEPTMQGKNRIALYSTEMGKTADSTVVAEFHSGFEIGTEWTTVSFAVNGVEAADYYLAFLGMSSDVYVADIQVQKAQQVADMRNRDYIINLANAYMNMNDWTEDELAECGLAENLPPFEELSETATQAEYDEALENLLGSLTGEGGIVDYMQNWLGTDPYNVLAGIGKRISDKGTDLGIWTSTPSKRMHNNNAEFIPEFPHYMYGSAWDRTAILETKELQKFPQGRFVFSLSSKGVVRWRNVSKNWNEDNGIDLFEGELYVLNEAGDTIAKSEKCKLSSSTYTPVLLTWELEKATNCKFGMKVTGLTDESGALLYNSANLGGTVFFTNASLYYVSEAAYTKEQFDYIADVQEQITAGTTNLTTANENIASTEKVWGKTALQACLDTVADKINAYDAMKFDTVAIVDTYEDDYVKSTSEATGYLVYEIYQSAVKDLIAANRTFAALNDTLAMIDNALVKSEALLKNRLYDASTERAQLESAIEAAKLVSAQMKGTDYSEENADLIEAELEKIKAAENLFKNSVPEDKIATLVDIDFSNAAEINEETSEATITGDQGTMTFTAGGYETTTTNLTFTQGFESNGEKTLSDVLRVGNGSAKVSVDASEMGTNILKVSMDFWFGGLIKRNVGFYLNSVSVNEDVTNVENVSGIFFSPYSATFEYNPCEMPTGFWTNVGSSSEADQNAGIYRDANKTSLTLYLDYGTKKAQLVSENPSKGEVSSEWVSFDASKAITEFELKSNYSSNAERRSWFDNLKIQKITAGAATITGDANGDGQVTMADANAIVNYFLAEDKTTVTIDATAADVNGDGDITMADANAVVNIYLGIEE